MNSPPAKEAESDRHMMTASSFGSFVRSFLLLWNIKSRLFAMAEQQDKSGHDGDVVICSTGAACDHHGE